MTTTPQPAPKWWYDASTIQTSSPVFYCDFSPALEISVSKDGISIDGWSFIKIERLFQFIRALEEAGDAHRVIKKGNHAAARTWVEKMNEEVEI